MSVAASTRLSGALTRVWSGPLSVAGELTLTDRRVRFAPTGALRALLKPHAFDLPLSAIHGMAWQGGRKRLALETAGGDILLEGGITPRVAASLAVMGVPFEDAPDLAAFGLSLEPLHHEAKAMRLVGAVHHAGWLALGGRGVAFEYSGLVEQLAGLPGHWIPVEAIRAVHTSGRSLRVDDGTEILTFQVDDSKPWMTSLARSLAAQPLPWDAELDEPTVTEADAPLLTLEASWQGDGMASVHRGRATLWRESGLLVQCLDGTRIEVPASAVQQAVYGRLERDQEPALRLQTEAGGHGWLRPRGGLDDLARLRLQALALPVTGALDLGEVGKLRRMEGAVTYTRVTTDHKDAVTIRPGFVVQAPDAVGLVLRGATGWRPPVGTRVRMTIANERYLIEVDGRVRRYAHLEDDDEGEAGDEALPEDAVTEAVEGAAPEAGAPPAPEGDEEEPAVVLFVSVPHPDNVRFKRTRRQHYRVPGTEAVQVQELRRVPGKGPMPWGVDRTARMVDLSAAGCAVLMPKAHRVGALLRIELPLRGRGAPLHAEVVYTQRLSQGEDVWYRHGLHFEGLTESEHALLAREVQRRETRAVRQIREDAEKAELEEAAPRPEWKAPGLT